MEWTPENTKDLRLRMERYGRGEPRTTPPDVRKRLYENRVLSSLPALLAYVEKLEKQVTWETVDEDPPPPTFEVGDEVFISHDHPELPGRKATVKFPPSEAYGVATVELTDGELAVIPVAMLKPVLVEFNVGDRVLLNDGRQGTVTAFGLSTSTVGVQVDATDIGQSFYEGSTLTHAEEEA